MKKFLLLAALGLSLAANAQLTVLNSGRVHVGDYTFTTTSPYGTLDVSGTSRVVGISGPSGSISFGGGSGASILGCSTSGILNLNASQSINFGIGSKSVVTLSETAKSFTSLYNMKAPAFLTTSDARLKANVESLSELYSKLEDVNAVSYTLSTENTTDKSVAAEKDSQANQKIEDNRTHFGFIAQEIQEIFPNLVVEDEEGMLAIDYTGFIPLLVEAYKDLTKKVKEQEEIISEMSNPSGPYYMPASVNGMVEQKASLKQNKPNPFNTSTTIECALPESVTSAFLCIYDLQGSQVVRMDIRERGTVNTVIDASSLRPGMYIYSLIADGIEVDSKRMIITD